MGKKISTDEFVIRAKESHGDKYDYSKTIYINRRTKIKIICPKHGEFEQRPDTHLEGTIGCKKCSDKEITEKEFAKKANGIHDNKYTYPTKQYINKTTKIKIICPKHGKFYQQPYAHLNGQGCPLCSINSSKSEEKISLLLKENNIDYIPQYTFNDCKNIKPLPFDFYLPEYNTCIEYDGQQHFISVDYWGGEKGLKYRQFNDKIKNDYCNDNNIIILRIKYNQDIDNVLKEFIDG